MPSLNFIAYLIIIFGIINIWRMCLFLVGSNIYSLKSHLNKKKKQPKYQPSFTVLVPAYNEKNTILRCVHSVIQNQYPKDKLDVIVLDDGSTDGTPDIVENYKRLYKVTNLQIVRLKNSGKANVLNYGLKNCTKGKLVMCLDSDSYLKEDAISKMVKYFADPYVATAASNVKIIDNGTLLNLIQKFEYLICYQMKRALTVANIEYIIGGIGSTFRKSTLEKVGFYDTDTVTEDIDLTMKIIRNGNKKYQAVYAADSIAYTESVLTVRDLIKQRFRWKWGRCQTFFKNKKMFFNSDKKYSKALTFFYLPFAIYGDIAYFFEPLMISYILYITIRYNDLITFLTAFIVISIYIAFNIVFEETIKTKDKILLLTIAPTMYLFFYILSFVEYIALIKAVIKLPKLKDNLNQQICHWQHVNRRNFTTTSTL